MVLSDRTVFLSGKEPLRHAGEVVGYVTSAGYGASVGQSIAYGYLPVALAEEGNALEVFAEGEWHRLTVAAEPLFDPDGTRMRAGDFAAV